MTEVIVCVGEISEWGICEKGRMSGKERERCGQIEPRKGTRDKYRERKSGRK